jgi:Protein of unknown function (DUF3048) N-terminal domain/Protein of unknown function (DUF3048) C-terminal domain
MAMTRRGRFTSTAVIVVVIGALVVGVMALTGRGPAAGLANLANNAIHHDPPRCPLTGRLAPGGTIPDRPALAIKVENLPESRPQSGLNDADIVYEEPVEAGITRFIAIYQCTEAARVEPVRSARLEDPDVVRQFGRALFAHAGGVPKVSARLHAAHLIDLNFIQYANAFHRDPSRYAPHNLYTSTAALWKVDPGTEGAPQPLFTYDRAQPATARKVAWMHLPFSDYSDVYWRWNAQHAVWLRYHGTVAHTLSNGAQVRAKNVVVQVVKVTSSSIHDVNGVASPFAHVVGHGKAYVLRGGRMIVGTWSRTSLEDITVFKDKQGNVIPLTPGNTWVELYPSDHRVTFGN